MGEQVSANLNFEALVENYNVMLRLIKENFILKDMVDKYEALVQELQKKEDSTEDDGTTESEY